MAEIPVCKDNWNGVKDENFTWNNNTGSIVTISQNGNATWPFQTTTNSITIQPHTKQACQLISSTGPFTYNANPCTTEGNPKNVIIG
jgi:hypothetical protein